MELLVKVSIPIKYLRYITFGSNKNYEYFKDQFNERGITSNAI